MSIDRMIIIVLRDSSGIDPNVNFYPAVNVGFYPTLNVGFYPTVNICDQSKWAQQIYAYRQNDKKKNTL